MNRKPHSEETKRKISIALKKYKNTEEQKKKKQVNFSVIIGEEEKEDNSQKIIKEN